MIQIEHDQGIVIAGMKGCGKTTVARHILAKIPRKRIWDPLGQYVDLGSYKPKSGHFGTIEEFSFFIEQCLKEKNVFIAVEECEQFAGHGKQLDELLNVITMGRNFGCGYMLITRRPVGANVTAFELADHVLIFRLRGRNDRRFVEEFLSDEYADLAAEICHLQKYEFVYVNPDNVAKKMPPIDL